MVLQRNSGSVSRKDVNPEREESLPRVAHPLVKYMWGEWRLIRDAIEGEREVKDGTIRYLPQLPGMDDDEYRDYLDRATYYNFTGRTLGALVGTLFRRKFRLVDVPADADTLLEHVSKTGSSLELLTETSAEEFLALGRFGCLVDLPTTLTATPEPYIVPYVAENILDWDFIVDQDTGREKLVRVVLREWTRSRPDKLVTRRWHSSYRELVIEGGVYKQKLYKAVDADADDNTVPVTTTPLIRGEPLTYIPFHIFEVARPPMQDIARLNISHYRSYAHLEHGRFYTGLPVYWTSTPTGGEIDYYIGPQSVWELPLDGRAGLLEFNGRGLNSLESALEDKEAQAASLGGRMIGVTSQSTAETDNQSALKDRNEQALLHRVARNLDFGWTRIVRWVLDFSNKATATAAVVFNKDFLYGAIGSREFRAVQSMYKDGILPVEIVYEYMVKAGVIDDELPLDVFKTMLEDEASFPNQPDFQARKEGFPNAQAKVSAELKGREIDVLDGELELAVDELDQKAVEAEKDRKAAAKVAAKGVGGGRALDAGVGAQREQLRGGNREVMEKRAKKNGGA